MTDSNTSSNETTPVVSTSSRLIGQVKWFNNKAGYGFITVSDGEYAGKDIFAHYSTILVASDSQYKYLVQGEYVEFEVSVSTNEKHEFQANRITGIKSGMLMCETRQTNRPVRNTQSRTYDRSVTDSVPAEGSVAVAVSSSSEKKQYSRSSDRKKPFVEKTTETTVDSDGFQTVRKRK